MVFFLFCHLNAQFTADYISFTALYTQRQCENDGCNNRRRQRGIGLVEYTAYEQRKRMCLQYISPIHSYMRVIGRVKWKHDASLPFRPMFTTCTVAVTGADVPCSLISFFVLN